VPRGGDADIQEDFAQGVTGLNWMPVLKGGERKTGHHMSRSERREEAEGGK